MKIICIGKNYRPENPDWKAPDEPVIFLKPDSSLLHKGNPFFIPEFSQKITVEAELAVRICRLGKYIDAKFAHKYYDAFTVGLDFTAQDLYDRLSAEGLPIDIAKGFDGAAVLGEWIDKASFPSSAIRFSLQRGGQEITSGHTADMLFSVDQLIAAVSKYYTLKIGDVILTGSPAASVPVSGEDCLAGCLEGREVFTLRIK